jgi:two-component system response regulator GlrR
LKVLLVEDNEDIREGLAAVLEGEGYTVSTSATAEEGLGKLAQDNFHLIVSDYMLPRETGLWMIQEAEKAGRLVNTKALIITAHPKVSGTDSVQVIRKPLDIDEFLRQVYELLDGARAQELEKARAMLQQNSTSTRADGALCELALYISSASPSSLRAVRNLNKLLDGYRPGQVLLKVCELAADTLAAAEEDRVTFTPTLVRRFPGPRTWVVGDLQNTRVVADLLDLAGVEPKA